MKKRSLKVKSIKVKLKHTHHQRYIKIKPLICNDCNRPMFLWEDRFSKVPNWVCKNCTREEKCKSSKKMVCSRCNADLIERKSELLGCKNFPAKKCGFIIDFNDIPKFIEDVNDTILSKLDLASIKYHPEDEKKLQKIESYKAWTVSKIIVSFRWIWKSLIKKHPIWSTMIALSVIASFNPTVNQYYREFRGWLSSEDLIDIEGHRAGGSELPEDITESHNLDNDEAKLDKIVEIPKEIEKEEIKVIEPESEIEAKPEEIDLSLDSDNDGVEDYIEEVYGSDPYIQDTDGVTNKKSIMVIIHQMLAVIQLKR